LVMKAARLSTREGSAAPMDSSIRYCED